MLLFILSIQPIAHANTIQDRQQDQQKEQQQNKQQARVIASAIAYPTQDEATQITQDIAQMVNAMSSGDVSVFVNKTHPALFPLLGGKENFTHFLSEALSQLDNLGVNIISNEFKQPGRFYAAGHELLTIVPRISVMEANGQKGRTIGFMIAIKNTKNNTWTYLDGSGMRDDRAMLWEMFPELEPDIVFPENKVDMIE